MPTLIVTVIQLQDGRVQLGYSPFTVSHVQQSTQVLSCHSAGYFESITHFHLFRIQNFSEKERATNRLSLLNPLRLTLNGMAHNPCTIETP